MNPIVASELNRGRSVEPQVDGSAPQRGGSRSRSTEPRGAAPRRIYKLPALPRDFSFLQRPLWGMVAFTPAAAVACMSSAALLPATLMGVSMSAAIIVGALVCTLGAAALMTFLERRYHGMPSAFVGEDELRRLADERRRHRLPGHDAPFEAGLSQLQASLKDGVADQGLEGRQRFGTQQLTPTAAYARQAPQPIAPGAWQVLSYGAPDGMAYNPIASRGLGTGQDARGAIAGGCIMDGMLIGLGALQSNSKMGGRVRPGEVFAGSMLGAWTTSLLMGSEVGYTALDSSFGLRLGSTTSVSRRDSLSLALNAPLPSASAPASSLGEMDVTRERSLGVGTTLSLSAATRFWGKGWLRPEVGQQVDTTIQQRVGESIAKSLFGQESSLWSSWTQGLGRAWLNKDTRLKGLDQNPLQRLQTLAQGDTIKLSVATRGGGITALSGQVLSYARPLQRFGVGQVLAGLVGFAGLAKLRQESHLLQVHCHGPQGPEQQLTVTWTHADHMTGRAYLTTPGAVGYDQGHRGIDSWGREVRVPHTQAAVRAIAALHRAVRNSDTSAEVQAWRALAGMATQVPRHHDLFGHAHSKALTVPTNLLPNELWSRWLPKGMSLETGWREQSSFYEHVQRAVPYAADGLEQASKQPVPLRGFTLSHDVETSWGPEGRKLCRVEAQVALGDTKVPQLTVANVWEMDRATSGEVDAFIFGPLKQLTEKNFSSLWGAGGWRAPRTAQLGLAFDAEQLSCAAEHILRHLDEVDPAAKEAWRQFAEKVRKAHGLAQGPQGWAGPGTPVGPLRCLADALESLTAHMKVAAVPALQRFLAEVAASNDDKAPAAPPLVLSGDSAAYGLPATLVRQLHLRQHKSPKATRDHATHVLGQISSCRALLASDCLVESGKRQAYEASFDLAEKWARKLRDAA